MQRTNAQGQFSFPNLDPSLSYTIFVFAPEHGTAEEIISMTSGQAWHGSFILQRATGRSTHVTQGNDDIIITDDLSHEIHLLGGNNLLTIRGYGNNVITGGSGDDVITIIGWGYNIINPGMGNNVIFGGTVGISTYVIGRGYGFNRIIVNNTGIGLRDALFLTNGIRPDEVYFVRVGNDLEIVVAEATNRITFVDFFLPSRNRISNIVFGCGAVITLSEIMNHVPVIPTAEYVPHDLIGDDNLDYYMSDPTSAPTYYESDVDVKYETETLPDEDIEPDICEAPEYCTLEYYTTEYSV